MNLTYRACKTLIENGKYNSKEDMQTKLDIFLLNDRITQDEYSELIDLLEQKEEEKTA